MKLVVMSATLDLQKFTNYFESDRVITVKGRTFPIEVFHTIQPQLDYMSACMKIILQIILFEEKGNILVFLPGQEEIDETQKMLVEKITLLKKQMDCVVLSLYANLPPHE